jgi:hypothetical protein
VRKGTKKRRRALAYAAYVALLLFDKQLVPGPIQAKLLD